MKKFSPISLALAYGIALGVPGFLPGKQANDQVLAFESSAADQGFYFPGEFEEQEAVWMGWPVGDNKAGWSVKDLHVRLWAAMAPHLYVKVAVNPDNAEEGITYAGQIAEITALMDKYSVPADRIGFYTIRHGDTWWRDMGPIYLIDGQGNRAVASFGFSVWGYESPDSPYSKQEEAVAAEAARLDGVEKIFKTRMVSEGGDREFNGKGVMIAVEAVERQRNPTLTLEQIEAEFKRVLGVKKIIWLKQGRYDDDLTFLGLLPNAEGKKELYTLTTTGGHVDEHVRFVGPNKLLYTRVTEDEANIDPIAAENKKRFEENLKILQGATDQDGQPFELIPMPDAPTITVTMGPGDGTYDYLAANDKMKELNRIPEGQPIQAILASSYLNFLVTNKVVLAPKFWKDGRPDSWKQLDEQARQTLQQVFPDREILTFDTSAINVGGGGIHCNTQQVPKARKN